MTADLAKIYRLRHQCYYYELDGADLIRQYTDAELAQFYNGTGPESWHPFLREVATKVTEEYQPAAMLHDTEFSVGKYADINGPASRADFHAANRRLKKNIRIIASVRHPWNEHPFRRIAGIFGAHKVYQKCESPEGWEAWVKGHTVPVGASVPARPSIPMKQPPPVGARVPARPSPQLSSIQPQTKGTTMKKLLPFLALALVGCQTVITAEKHPETVTPIQEVVTIDGAPRIIVKDAIVSSGGWEASARSPLWATENLRGLDLSVATNGSVRLALDSYNRDLSTNAVAVVNSLTTLTADIAGKVASALVAAYGGGTVTATSSLGSLTLSQITGRVSAKLAAKGVTDANAAAVTSEAASAVASEVCADCCADGSCSAPCSDCAAP